MHLAFALLLGATELLSFDENQHSTELAICLAVSPWLCRLLCYNRCKCRVLNQFHCESPKTMTKLLPALAQAALVLFVAGPVRGAADYERDIKPLLRGRCYACHGALKQKSGLRLDTVELMLKGGESGEVRRDAQYCHLRQ